MTRLSLTLWMVCLSLLPRLVAAQAATCSLQYNLPGDIPVPTSEANNDTFQEIGWQSFLALNAPSVGGQISTNGDNVPQWSAWSSTADLLNCQGNPTPAGCVCTGGDCGRSGSRYYPPACQTIPSYQNYRTLGQVGKVDDSFEEATTGGLSGDPVIDRFGNFLRYEILLSPATYDNVIEDQLFDPDHVRTLTSDINMICGVSTYTGGDPANPQMGALVMKLAWMDVTQAVQTGAIDGSKYHLEQLLVYNPAYRNSTNQASCQLRTMALVGMHFEHKTVNQPVWIWSTFEHDLNAPDCIGPIPGPGTQQPNASCPSSVSEDFNFYAQDCSNSGKACAPCNDPPATNGTCTNPSGGPGKGYCLDQAPNPTGGESKLCRQIPIANYPRAAAWNTACKTALGPSSVWSNYSLISSQWGTSAIPAGCADVAEMVATTPQGPVIDSVIRPLVTSGTATKPLLGNTTMESYDRSNCMGCHAKANVMNSAGTSIRTDFMYWLQLEVFAPAVSEPPPAPSPTAAASRDDDDSCSIVDPVTRHSAWQLLLPIALLWGLRRRRSHRG